MIGLIGLNHKSAPIEIRERYSFSDEEITCFYRLLQIETKLKGVVVLSTCNRTEIYFHFDELDILSSTDFIFRNLSYFKNYTKKHLQYFYIKSDKDTIEHLFRVVSGLDSLIVGEDQIIGQVKNAFKHSLDQNILGTVLTRLFNKAFETGKRVRTETAINQGAGSVSSAAFELCKLRFPDFVSRNIVLIGAGETGTLAITNFVKRDCSNIFITNRTFDKAKKLATCSKATAFEFSQLDEYLPKADILIVATSSKQHLITKHMCDAFSGSRTTKQLFIDLSVPRNIDSEVGRLPNIELVSVDDLRQIVQNTSEKRTQSVTDAEDIINEVIAEFTDWLHSLTLTPIFIKIKDNLKHLNLVEMQGFLKNNTKADSDLLAEYMQQVTNKCSRVLIRNVKTVTDNGKNKDVVKLISKLFELD